MPGTVVRRLREFATANPSRFHLEEWAKEAGAQGTDPSFIVLDAGAGDSPYARYFSHVTYETADFLQLDKPYARPTYECDLTSIPVEDQRFDLVLATQVFEHMSDPLRVLCEFHRVVKPDGQVWLSAPLFYEEHETPYDFFRYTQYGWRHIASEAGFEVVS